MPKGPLQERPGCPTSHDSSDPKLIVSPRQGETGEAQPAPLGRCLQRLKGRCGWGHGEKHRESLIGPEEAAEDRCSPGCEAEDLAIHRSPGEPVLVAWTPNIPQLQGHN